MAEDTTGRSWDLATSAMAIVVAADVVVGLYYRFTTTSKLWLDEAQTVNIASFPVRMLPAQLRRDGAPPLYYLFLHFWMGLVGHSDMDVRALSGVFAVLTLPVMWWVVRRGFGRIEAIGALAMLATSPFAVYFATETRMYSLVIFLVTAGIGAVMALLSRPTVPRALLVAVLASLLIYTHYWAFYLLAAGGLWFAFLVVADKGPRRRGALFGLAAMALGALSFIPWLSSFQYQRAHTGTPWASGPSLASTFGWIGGFIGNQSVQAQAFNLHLELGLIVFLLLLIFGYAASPVGRDVLEFRLLGQPRARVLTVTFFVTLAIAYVASRQSNTAFQPRYAAIVFPIAVILVGLGVAALPNRWLQVGAVCALSALGLWTTHWGAHVQRSQSGKLAVTMHAHVPTSAVVVVCPDQLGPSLLRYAGRSSYDYVGFPRFTSPWLVDWVDYKDAVNGASLSGFSTRVTNLAGPSAFYLVWSKGYGVHTTCEDLVGALARASGRSPTTLVVAQKYQYYQSMNLLKYAPHS
ncbi:MAG TPA: glycosyltransferase family 39 protein [Acidimicrobiales bacterium]|nr:glycosyltransferase family 39 protein [Acidimicrobiales bacterium]